MELTTEQKARMFALYLGAPVAVNGKPCGSVTTVDYRASSVGIQHAGYSSWKKLDETKLLLRPLDSVTDEEWFEVEQATDLVIDVIGYGYLKKNFVSDKPDERFGWCIINQALQALRQLGIDVDGKIAAGLAIDITKQQEHGKD